MGIVKAAGEGDREGKKTVVKQTKIEEEKWNTARSSGLTSTVYYLTFIIPASLFFDR
jgi:hypothetical protein